MSARAGAAPARWLVTRTFDLSPSLPDRRFEVPVTVGADAGEQIDRAEFDGTLCRFDALSSLDEQGHPAGDLRTRLATVLR